MKLDSDPMYNTASLLTTKANCVLVDIEGTTSSIEFVYDVLFPYARKHLRDYLQKYWRTEPVQVAVTYLARDLDFESAEAWLKTASAEENLNDEAVGDADLDRDKLIEKHQQEKVALEIERLMDADVKSTGLKELQGLIWAEGYNDGVLSSHVFADVAPVFDTWQKHGIEIRIFSSGSINAQKIFFKHTEYGDLNKFLNGNYDTTTGPKRESTSYKAIAEDIGVPPKEILFLSDVEQELDAAKAAGMKVALVVRPGNPATEKPKHHVVENFDQISIIQ